MTDDNPPDKAWFTEKMRGAGLNGTKMATLLGFTDRSLFSKRLSGGTRFTAAECADIARLLKTPVDEVMRRAGIAAPTLSQHKVPIDGVAMPDGSVRPIGRSDVRSTEIPDGLGLLHGLTISGGAFDGGTAFYSPSSTIQAEAVGALAVVTMTGGKRLLGRLDRGRERGRWTVMAMSGELAGEDIIATTASAVQWVRL